MDFNFGRRTKKLCCAAYIDREIDHGMYNSFYLDILKVVNTYTGKLENLQAHVNPVSKV